MKAGGLLTVVCDGGSRERRRGRKTWGKKGKERERQREREVEGEIQRADVAAMVTSITHTHTHTINNHKFVYV